MPAYQPRRVVTDPSICQPPLLVSLLQSYRCRAIQTTQVHRTSKSLIASTGVDSEWTHAEANTAANPATAYLNADLWYRCCLLPAGHEFLYRTPALCSNASYSQANVPVTIVLSSKVRGPCFICWCIIYSYVLKMFLDWGNWLLYRPAFRPFSRLGSCALPQWARV